MAQKVVAANQLVNLDMAYEGYDPGWIIGAQGDPLPHYSYGPYAAAAGYSQLVNPSQSYVESSYRGFFNNYDPYRRTLPTPSYYGGVPPRPQMVVPGPLGPVVRAAKVVPTPMVTTIIYPHGHGHTLGTGHGHKNIILMRIPCCCEGCEDKWKDKVMDIPGVKGVNVDRRIPGDTLRATIFGDMDTHSVVKTIQKVQPRAEFWGAL